MFNCSIAAKKRGSDIIFLRKIVKGGTDDSFGIEVASLAGVPGEVVNRAKKILKELESASPAPERARAEEREDDNISFADITGQRIIDKLKDTDINTITPIEAMSLLYELKRSAES